MSVVERHLSIRNPCLTLLVAALALIASSFAQSTTEFHRSLSVAAREPLTLDVDISKADVQILYGRDGEVSISGSARSSRGLTLDDNFFSASLTIQQDRNHITIRHGRNPPSSEREIGVLYRIEVPYRTEVVSQVKQGRQSISGIMGPARATSGQGDIKASYISKGIQAQVESGNIDLQVIGERAEAQTGAGNINCERIPQGVTAETGDGDIALMVIGATTATVKKGTGRIEVGGARGSLIATTAEGDLHVKAFPHDDWKLTSTSGSIRLELPPQARLTFDAATSTGEFQIERDDITKPQPGIRHISQDINSGGKRIDVLTGSGRIVIR